MLTFTTFREPSFSSAMLSSTGATDQHGPHQAAQKSTSTGISLCKTSCTKVSLSTFFANMGIPLTLLSYVVIVRTR